MWKSVAVLLACAVTLVAAQQCGVPGPTLVFGAQGTHINGMNMVVVVETNSSTDTAAFTFVNTPSGLELTGSQNCAPLSGQTWTRGTDIPATGDCTQATVRWQATYRVTDLLGQCGFSKEANPASSIAVKFTGTLRVSETDNEGTHLGSTTIAKTWVNQLQLQLQASQNASANSTGTNTQVFGPTILASATTRRTFTVGDGIANYGTLNLELLSSVQDPYQISSLAVDPTASATFLTTYNLNPSSLVSTIDSGCTGAAELCNQKWTVAVTPKTNSTCTFTGTVTFIATYTCFNPNVACTTPDPATSTIVVTLSSESMCPQVIETLTLTGELKIYTDAARTTIAGTSESGAKAFPNLGASVYLTTFFNRPASISFASCTLVSAQTIFDYGANDKASITIVGDNAIEDTNGLISFVDGACTSSDGHTLSHNTNFFANLPVLRFPGGASSGEAKMMVQYTYNVVYQNAANQLSTEVVTMNHEIRPMADTEEGAATMTSPQVGVSSGSGSSSSTILGVSQGTVVIAGIAVGAVALIAIATVTVIRRRRRTATVKKTESTTELVANQA